MPFMNTPAALPGQAAPRRTFIPGVPWPDTSGAIINAHGGGVIHAAGRYYWHGEYKIPGRSEKEGASGGVSVYSSDDLYNWKNEGLALALDTENPRSEIAAGCMIERPKVLFNERTGLYVMLFKLYPPGGGYDTACVGVATSARPQGPFRYRHRFLGGGSPKGTGDFAMFKDRSGAAWHMTVRKPDKVFVMGRLRADYLHPDGKYKIVPGITAQTEAPAVLFHEGLWHLVGSGSTWWEPNAARWFSAAAPGGPYEDRGNPCRDGVNPHNGQNGAHTFGGQISFLMPVEGRPGAFIALFDIWRPERASDGLYAWLPVIWSGGALSIPWRDRWDFSVFGV
jgi:hypothetical protein